MSLADLIPFANRSPGLSSGEIDAAQDQTGVRFPPDLCELLTETLPVGAQFPDWRHHARASFEEFRQQLIEGIEFDAIHNAVWLTSWGEKPSDQAELRAVVRASVLPAPAVIPIYAHRGIPNEPLEVGNPVFSIMQTDIIVYGADLANYLRNEFGPASQRDHSPPARSIRFWTELLKAGI